VPFDLQHNHNPLWYGSTIQAEGCHRMKKQAKARRLEPISLYPLKLDDIVRDVLTIPPPPKKDKRQPSGKRRVRSSQR